MKHPAGGSLRGALALLAAACVLHASSLEEGARAFARQDYASAERLLHQAIREQPSSPLAHKLLGLTYSVQEKYAEAEEPLRRACSLNAREENACYYLGRLLYTLNRFDESLRTLESAARQGVQNRGKLALATALTLEALGRDAESEKQYGQAIAAGEKRALIDYGMFLHNHGRGAEALPLLKRADARQELQRVQDALRASAGPEAASTGSKVRFESRALPMAVRNGAAGSKHQIETMPAGVAVFDYDNDGWPDIYVANGASVPDLSKNHPSFHNRLFRNNHDMTFSDVTERAGVSGTGFSMGVAAADYDNDGLMDLFVTGVRSVTLFRNQGDGSFRDVTRSAGVRWDGSWTVAAGWFDYDRDGKLDLFVVRYVEWDPASERWCGPPGKPELRTYCHPQHYRALPNALFHNEGEGKFRDVSAESGIAAHAGKGMGVVFGDYDGDGLLDVFVANDTVPNFLFHNKGAGRFEEVGLAAGVALNSDGLARSSMGADFRDYDNDGREDVFVTDLTNERFLLFRNLGGGQFGDVSGPSRIAAESLPWSGWSTGLYDFNNDGWKDLFVAAGNVSDTAERTSSRLSRQPNLLFTNRGDRTFELDLLPGSAFHRGAAFGDFNRDGLVDAVVTRLNEAPLVLRNITPNSGHWIGIQLRGTVSNRDGLGARVRVRSASGEQWNRATTSVGYGGSSEPTVFFGLGGDARAVEVEVYWPSGVHQTLRDVPVDRFVRVAESGPPM